MIIEQKKILLGVTGGIAAYKAAHLVRLLRKEQAEVRVVMTRAAQDFITPNTLAVLSENPVELDLWESPTAPRIPHIELAEWAEIALVAPATANSIGKAANGIADDLLSNIVLSLQCPVVIAPAMHTQMWTHPAVQKNIDTLKSFGYHIIDPAEGELASGGSGVGRMQEPEAIVRFIKMLG